MGIETFKETLVAGVETEVEFAESSAFVSIRNRSVYPVFVYLKDDADYNEIPIALLSGRKFERPIVTDAIKLLSVKGGTVEVVAVPSSAYGQASSTVTPEYIISRQADCSSAIPTNTDTAGYVIVSTAGNGAVIGDLLLDDGSESGAMEIVSASEGRVIVVTDALAGGAEEFEADSIYIWDADGEAWIVGIQGPQGIQGEQGEQGIQGTQGIQGIQGTQGIQGDPGNDGADGDSSYSYIAYASDASGTDFTTTFDAGLDYIAFKTTTSPIASPVVGDFAGLWKNYKGATGDTGSQGIQGIQGEQGEQGDAGADALQLQYYESAELTIANVVTQAHSLGKIPDFHSCVLRCVTTDSTYAVGDEIVVGYSAYVGAPYPLIMYIVNATNFVFQLYGATTDLSVLDNDGGGDQILLSRWKIIFKALTRPPA